MAPEVMCRQNHGVPADYFAVGVIAYECMFGRRPYIGKSRKEIREQILARQACIRKSEVPDGWSPEAMDFINRLLQRKPAARLGLQGDREVKEHPWLSGVPWDGLKAHTYKAPYIPNANEDNFDLRSSNDSKKDLEDAIKQSSLLLREGTTQALFNGYYYDEGNPQPANPEGLHNAPKQHSLASSPSEASLFSYRN